jgi:hypothetical protein
MRQADPERPRAGRDGQQVQEAERRRSERPEHADGYQPARALREESRVAEGFNSDGR